MFDKASTWLGKYKPMLREWRFWAIQGIILAVAEGHHVLEIYNPGLSLLYVLPIGILWIPVTLAALKFGTPGAVATAWWALVSALPEWILLSSPSQLGEIIAVALLLVLAVVIGRQVDLRISAQRMAMAAAAFVLSSQEDERRRLSFELHDETIQHLVVVRQQLDMLSNFGDPLPAATLASLEAVKAEINSVITGVRNVARGLRPPLLDSLGLFAAVRRLLGELTERTGIDSHLEVSGEERRLPEEVETQAFRIIQEALRNVERHAKATRVAVTLSLTDREIKVDIADNGTGFDVSKRSDHAGLIGVTERAKMLGGRLNISSSAGKGTRVATSLPIKRPGNL